jgi:hypothetical protein
LAQFKRLRQLAYRQFCRRKGEEMKHSEMVQQLGTGYSGERGGLLDAQAYRENFIEKIERTVPWTTPGLTITRLRLLSDPGFPAWDVSYCHGKVNGEPVEVSLPFNQLPKRGISRAIVAHAKHDGVFAKGIGILDCISTLI